MAVKRSEDNVTALPPLDGGNLIRGAYEAHLLGARVEHKITGVYGRLSGHMRYERGNAWFEVDTDSGSRWWLGQNITRLGPIPVPRGGGA
jgi:hypothetical protein